MPEWFAVSCVTQVVRKDAPPAAQGLSTTTRAIQLGTKGHRSDMASWVSDFNAWVKPQVSELNYKRLCPVVECLAAGKGAKCSTRRGANFLEGVFLTLDDDLIKFREEGRSWAFPTKRADSHPSDRIYDPTRGWAVDHPLSWLQRYKTRTSDEPPPKASRATPKKRPLPPPSLLSDTDGDTEAFE